MEPATTIHSPAVNVPVMKSVHAFLTLERVDVTRARTNRRPVLAARTLRRRLRTRTRSPDEKLL
jgi:hypothetical protein